MRQRQHHLGLLYSICGGAPNRPTVALAGDAGWIKGDSDWRFDPQSISFNRGYSRAGDVDDIKEWLQRDLETRRADLPVLISIETSQSPHIYSALREELDDDKAIVTHGYRLRGGDQSVMDGSEASYLEGAQDVGANWLVSWFDATAAREAATEQRHGRPYVEDRIAITFENFSSGVAPDLQRDRLQASLNAAESLRAKAQRDGDINLALNADESIAACLMLGALIVDQTPPPLQRRRLDEAPWGWDGPLNRRLHV
jgi:hypothetical protein